MNNQNPARGDTPNILLITTDTQRCDTLHCMGNPHAFSPHLDRLAAEGVLFRNAHTAAPACRPTRCSLLTGTHTPVHGCIENGIRRRTDCTVFTDLLHNRGYATIMAGKTHFDPVPESFEIRYIVHGEKNAKTRDIYAEHLARHGFARQTGYPNPVPEHLHMDSFIVNKTIQGIDEALAQHRPFFAFCSLFSPHGPLDPPGKWGSFFENRPLPEINYTEGELDRLPSQLKMMLNITDKTAERENPALITCTKNTRESIDFSRRLYYGLASYCDARIGRLIEYLDKKGLREKTLVIFSSDHGQQFFDHGFNDKHTYYDGSFRVPLIMSMPGSLPAGEERDFAVWTDITASILGAAGCECPSVQGFDLFTPLCRGEESPRRCAVGTLYQSAALVTNTWKLEYYCMENEGRLYNRIDDPLERVNLYDNEKYAGIRDALRTALLRWRAETIDIERLVTATGGGGPVAKRVAAYSRTLRGSAPEERLGRAAEEIDAIPIPS